VLIHCRTVVTVSKLLADAKVTQFGNAKSRLYKNVVWLDISMDLLAFVVQVVKGLKDVPGETSNYKLRNQCFDQAVNRPLALLFNRNNRLKTAAVHILHH
jgi:hypothetical protein